MEDGDKLADLCSFTHSPETGKGFLANTSGKGLHGDESCPGAELVGFRGGLTQQLAPRDHFLTWVFLSCGAPFVACLTKLHSLNFA